MIIYEMEYGFEVHRFVNFKKMLKCLRQWWWADGSPHWYDMGGKRTHFPTDDEIIADMYREDGFYRDYDTAKYVVIRMLHVEE